MVVHLLDSLEAIERTVLIAGCSPAISLWARGAQRWHPGLRANWIHANSSDALEALGRGEVHLAGLHWRDAPSGEDNAPLVRAHFQNEAIVLINFGVWDEGLMVKRSNPRRIRSVCDLCNGEITFINREIGAGARQLFDSLLRLENRPAASIVGYENTVSSHQAVARVVSEGRADAGMGTAAMAAIFGLDFVPLQSVRFDFALRAASLQHEPVAQLFETLSHPSVRLQLQKLGGYDTTLSGEIVARVDKSPAGSV